MLLLFRALCVIIKDFMFECVEECVCQQGTLWQHGEDQGCDDAPSRLEHGTRELVAMRQLSSNPTQFCSSPFM